MAHWLATAISTYLLHPLRGNGYQWWSGPGALVTGVGVYLRKHNCHQRRCPWFGHVTSPRDGHLRCKRHHRQHLAEKP